MLIQDGIDDVVLGNTEWNIVFAEVTNDWSGLVQSPHAQQRGKRPIDEV